MPTSSSSTSGHAPRQSLLLLYGGPSTEHEVSCRSAAFIATHYDSQRYRLVLVWVDRQGRWWPQAQLSDEASLPAKKGGTEPAPALKLPCLSEVGDEYGQELIEKLWRPGGARADKSLKDLVIFPIIHGHCGEDGLLQGFFGLQDCAFVGPDVLGSSLGIDKDCAKTMVAAAGIKVTSGLVLRQELWQRQPSEWLRRGLEMAAGSGLFIKPACQGSSVGVSHLKKPDAASLAAAIGEALSFDHKILIEKAMDVREIEFACLGGYEPEISGAGEVSMAEGFYSYDEKYGQKSQALVRVPADIPPELEAEGRRMSAAIYRALQLYGLARVDLFLCKKTGEFSFNEVNTLPGMTAISQYPQLWAAAGIGPRALIDRLLASAWQRQADGAALKRSL